MPKATEFSDYSNMPVKKTKKNAKTHMTDHIENTWFKQYIRGLEGLEFKDEGRCIVGLSKHNSEIIEKAIGEDESYNALFTKKMHDYYDLKNGRCPQIGVEAKEPIQDLIRMIDLENSTNQWRYKEKRVYLKRMVEFIVDPKNEFWDDLKEGKADLPDRLREYAFGSQSIDASEGKDGRGGPRSLASKVCRYFSEYFDGNDNYYINDSVVRHVLPYYLNCYGIPLEKNTKTHFKELSYKKLHAYLEALRGKTDPKLKRRELDHILWYSYRFEDLGDGGDAD